MTDRIYAASPDKLREWYSLGANWGGFPGGYQTATDAGTDCRAAYVAGVAAWTQKTEE